MEIKNLKLADLRLNPTNPREVVEEKYKQLIDSILVFPKMLQLQAIYKRYINPHHTPNAWCSHCCVATLKGLYQFAKEVIYGTD